jgi:hypothetical protein
MSHDGPTLKTMHQTTGDMDTYMKGWFTFKQEDGTEATLHVGSTAGKKAIADIRLHNDFDEDWQPNTLDPIIAPRNPITTNLAHIVRQHGGMGKGATRDLDFVVSAELGFRSNSPQGITGNAAQPPETPARQKIPSPDHEGIAYPTSDGYHQMTRSEKLKTTKRINLRRLERGMAKWTPPGTPSKRKKADREATRGQRLAPTKTPGQEMNLEER